MQTPNPPPTSDPACVVFRALSSSRLLGFVQRLGAGGSAWSLSSAVTEGSYA